jgi:hypothetical protein
VCVQLPLIISIKSYSSLILGICRYIKEFLVSIGKSSYHHTAAEYRKYLAFTSHTTFPVDKPSIKYASSQQHHRPDNLLIHHTFGCVYLRRNFWKRRRQAHLLSRQKAVQPNPPNAEWTDRLDQPEKKGKKKQKAKEEQVQSRRRYLDDFSNVMIHQCLYLAIQQSSLSFLFGR